MIGYELDYEITRSGHVYSRRSKKFIKLRVTADKQATFIQVSVNGVKSPHLWPKKTADESWAAEEIRQEQKEEQIERQIRTQATLPETVRESLVKARIGQGVFRENVSKVEKACRLTGVRRLGFLIASHIKPWRDSDNQERLDGNNGLLLTPNIDFLFDRGYISFEDNGNLLVSQAISRDILRAMGVNTDEPSNVGTFNSAQQKYLLFHRTEIFRTDPSE
ncbi:HNH endonuclease [Archangium primigenium]|uniref:HNH endonuclease n=1 Tax=[Archangium] primigenium TaxID=2792470 RepID=UPI001959F125|nr:HNH endonuclease [Archangium primigenium]MBM7118366.1 HNH endonuclease [Archangium primigenium]